MKKRFDLVKMEKVAALAAPLLSIAGLQAQEKPLNVIYIMSDDHTSQSIGLWESFGFFESYS